MRGLSALELIIIFAVTAICVSAGTPLLTDFSVRTKVVEALTVAAGVKTALTMTCEEAPNLTTLDDNLIGYKFQKTNYVQAVYLDGSCALPIIKIVTTDTGAQIDPTLIFSGNFTNGRGKSGWTCTSDGVSAQLPKECRENGFLYAGTAPPRN
jgi:hypothetical protein